jgi:hypothetical protein
MTTPKMLEHLGREITCSLMCSRTYRRSDSNATQARPLLLCMRLKRDIRLFSAYLPADVFWALQTDLKSGRLKYVEARFNKPRYGSGELISLYFSDTQPGE